MQVACQGACHPRVLIYVRPYERVELADPGGSTADLLALLANGTRTIRDLAMGLTERGHPVGDEEVSAAVSARW